MYFISNVGGYIPKNNYTKFKWQTKIDNSFQIDFLFIRKLYNIKKSNDQILTYIFEEGIYNGMIVHRKQLKNMFPNIQILSNRKTLFIKFYDKTYIANDFYKKIINPLCYNYFLKNSIYFIYKNFSYYKKFNINIILFIGNIGVGISIIKRINTLDTNFVLSIVIKNTICIEKIKQNIKKNVDFIIYKCNEFGNDIIPSILLYDKIKQNIQFDYIIKIHTKTNTRWRENLINYLFKTNFYTLKKSANTTNSNVVGCKKYFSNPQHSKYNKQLIEKYNNFIDKKYFIAGTMFFCKKELFEKMSNFIQENNFKQFLFNNMYDTNNIIINSPIHFLERLFGIIQ